MQMPTIHDVSKEFGSKTMKKAICELILISAKSFKFSEKMEMQTAIILTGDLYSYFKNESIEDVALMLKMARTGQLGSGKGRLDSDTLFNVFIPEYLDLKAVEREKEHKRNKTNFAQVKMSEESYEKFDQLSKRLKANQEEKMAEKTKPVVNHHQMYINSLKNRVKILNDKQLDDNLKNLLASDNEVFSDAIQIVKEEIEKRKQNADNNNTKTKET